ncbi:MAG: prealbumin-like fold domain-containing protein [Oscillospiraceae bacterium]|jgi:hypothetical protein|nr:prealbumin-like fold domain-containing protein [Oscillospiraceae bacterium]
MAIDIYTPTEFNDAFTTTGEKNLRLLADIDLTSITYNTIEFSYKVVIEGNNHIIKTTVPLFTGLGADSLFQDLTVNITYSGTASSVGAFARQLTNIVTFTNCYVTGSVNVVSASAFYVGGFVGSCANGKFLRCGNRAAVLGGFWVGGITGDANVCCFNSCSNEGSPIRAYSQDCGGLCGRATNSGFRSCVNRGEIVVYNGGSGNYFNFGGIAGGAYSSVIVDCLNAGSVTAPTGARPAGSLLGGIAGVLFGVSLVLACRNTRNIQGGNPNQDLVGVGGIIGRVYGPGTLLIAYNEVVADPNQYTIFSYAGAGGIVGVVDQETGSTLNVTIRDNRVGGGVSVQSSVYGAGGVLGMALVNQSSSSNLSALVSANTVLAPSIQAAQYVYRIARTVVIPGSVTHNPSYESVITLSGNYADPGTNLKGIDTDSDGTLNYNFSVVSTSDPRYGPDKPHGVNLAGASGYSSDNYDMDTRDDPTCAGCAGNMGGRVVFVNPCDRSIACFNKRLRFRSRVSGVPAKGITLNVKEGNEVKATGTTDEEGKVALCGLAPGTYTLEAVNASGWLLPSPAPTMVIGKYGGVTIDGKTASENAILDPDLTSGYDDYLSPLPDAVESCVKTLA